MNRLLHVLLVIAGLTLFLSLPGLWLAWESHQLWSIFAVGVAAGVAYLLLYALDDLPKPPGRA